MYLPCNGDNLQNISFFGDSSSRDKEYMVAGGFAISGNRINEVEDHIATLRDDYGIKSEFHWSEYRGGNRKKAYEALIKYGFDLVSKRKAALHVIVSPFKDFNHRTKECQNKDTSINLVYYQLCLHRLCAFYGRSRAIHIRLDAGNDSAEVCENRVQLCIEAYKKFNTKPNCVRSIEPVDSELVGAVQMADVIVGGIAANLNATEYSPNSKKKLLSDFILRSSGRTNWSVSTPKSAKFLTVWNFRV